MSNVIAGIILIVMVMLGVKETIKHFRGEGACCGGLIAKPRKKKLKNKIVYKKVFFIDGMHCQNCANAVTRAVNDMDGAFAKVNLRKKTVKVFCDREIDNEQIKHVIEKKGYTVHLNLPWKA